MDKKQLFEKLSEKEKISLFDGLNAWQTRPIKSINFRSVWLSDGPHGLRKEKIDNNSLGFSNVIPSICFPTSALLSCTFDKNMAFLQGKSIGNIAFNNGVDMILGPGINIKRHPLCGRNFEYFSEDPYLSGIFANYYAKGIKSENVACCIKHYCLNNQEYHRFVYSSDCDIQTMFDMYLKPFYLAIKDNDVDAIMASYNQINGIYSCQNDYLLNEVLRKQFNFKGFVVSDWGAVNDHVFSFVNGLNLIMPGNNCYVIEDLNKLYDKKLLTKKQIDKTIWPLFSFIYDRQNISFSSSLNLDTLYDNAYEIAKEGIVLAKNNDNILPLNNNETVGFIGQFIKNIHIQGGGSSKINSLKTTQIIDYLNELNIKYLYADGYDIKTMSSNLELINKAIDVAKNVDKIVLFLGLFDNLEAEGNDKNNMNIPSFMVDLFNKIYEINKNIVLVLLSGSPLEIPFFAKTKAIVLPYLCGDMGSKAIVDILYGKVNPSGHLSETWPYSINDTYLKNNYPIREKNVLYNEGVFVGYRYYLLKNITPMFCFGHGLSYSKFSYENFNIDNDEISFKISNLSSIDGKQVIQIYVEDEVNKIRHLVDFYKYEIKANESLNIKIKIKEDYFKSYSQFYNDYIVKKGNYKIYVAVSVLDILAIFDYQIDGKEEPYKYQIDLNISPSKLKDNSKKGNFDMNSSLLDFKSTSFGRFLNRIIIDQFNKKVDKNSLNYDFMLNELLNMPFRGIISWANSDVLTYKNGLAILDILNGKYSRSIKTFFKK